MGSLVSELLTPVTRGLEALQKNKVTARMWRRLANDHEFAAAVAREMERADLELRGEKRTIFVSIADNRVALWEQLSDSGTFKHGSMLARNIVLALSTRVSPSPTKSGATDLFLTSIWSQMSFEELSEELRERHLISATTHEALAFAREHQIPRSLYGMSDPTIVVPSARIETYSDIITEPHVLRFGRLLSCDATMTLSPVAHGITSGTIVLTKDAEQ